VSDGATSVAPVRNFAMRSLASDVRALAKGTAFFSNRASGKGTPKPDPNELAFHLPNSNRRNKSFPLCLSLKAAKEADAANLETKRESAQGC